MSDQARRPLGASSANSNSSSNLLGVNQRLRSQSTTSPLKKRINNENCILESSGFKKLREEEKTKSSTIVQALTELAQEVQNLKEVITAKDKEIKDQKLALMSQGSETDGLKAEVSGLKKAASKLADQNSTLVH